MRNLYVLIVVCFFAAFKSSAQNTPRFGQFNFAQGVNNPAALALDSRIMVDMVFRNQWAGIKGAPNTGAINAQYELYHDMAVGLVASYDQIGVHHATQVSGQYSYRAFLANGNAMIFGASVGMDQRINDLASAQTIQHGDPAFSTSYSRLHFNFGFGIFYYSPRFYFGASIPQFLQNTIRGKEKSFVPPKWHYYASTGYYFHINDNYTLNPHLQVKAVLNAPIQADLILRNTFVNTWSLILGYRSENSLIAGVDFLVAGRFRCGYSFNYDVGGLARTKGGSHELYVGIGLPYHNSREEFGQRRYLNKKGAYKRDFYKGHKRRKWYK